MCKYINKNIHTHICLRVCMPMHMHVLSCSSLFFFVLGWDDWDFTRVIGIRTQASKLAQWVLHPLRHCSSLLCESETESSVHLLRGAMEVSRQPPGILDFLLPCWRGSLSAAWSTWSRSLWKFPTLLPTFVGTKGLQTFMWLHLAFMWAWGSELWLPALSCKLFTP